MEGYVSEQEQIDAIKKWLKENGPAIVIGIALGLGGISGWRYWQVWQARQAATASSQFEEVMATSFGDKIAAQRLGLALMKKQPRSPYASFTALLLAKLAVERQDLATAKQHLTWAIEHSRQPDLRRLAQQRLARVLLAEGKADEAWETLAKIDNGDNSAAVLELKGDIKVVQGKREEARKYYKSALDLQDDPAAAEASALALKLDDLGELSATTGAKP